MSPGIRQVTRLVWPPWQPHPSVSSQPSLHIAGNLHHLRSRCRRIQDGCRSGDPIVTALRMINPCLIKAGWHWSACKCHVTSANVYFWYTCRMHIRVQNIPQKRTLTRFYLVFIIDVVWFRHLSRIYHLRISGRQFRKWCHRLPWQCM